MCDYTQHVCYIEYSVSITVIGNCLGYCKLISCFSPTSLMHFLAMENTDNVEVCWSTPSYICTTKHKAILLVLRTWAPLSTSHLTKISVDMWRGIAMSVLLVSNINWICTIASWQRWEHFALNAYVVWCTDKLPNSLKALRLCHYIRAWAKLCTQYHIRC